MHNWRMFNASATLLYPCCALYLQSPALACLCVAAIVNQGPGYIPALEPNPNPGPNPNPSPSPNPDRL